MHFTPFIYNPLKVKGLIQSACVAGLLAHVNLMTDFSPRTWIFIKLIPRDPNQWVRVTNGENNMRLIVEMLVNIFTFLDLRETVWDGCGAQSTGAGIWALSVKSSLLSSNIATSLHSDRGLSDSTETKRESISVALSDWSNAALVLDGVSTDYMRLECSWDFSHGISTFSPNLQAPYWHFWHHLLEILDSSQLSRLHKTVAAVTQTAT